MTIVGGKIVFEEGQVGFIYCESTDDLHRSSLELDSSTLLKAQEIFLKRKVSTNMSTKSWTNENNFVNRFDDTIAPLARSYILQCCSVSYSQRRRSNANLTQVKWLKSRKPLPTEIRKSMPKRQRTTTRIQTPLVFIIDRPPVLVRSSLSASSLYASIDLLGVRNLFDSSFMLSGNDHARKRIEDSDRYVYIGAQWDDGNMKKTTRGQQPPGGQSKGECGYGDHSVNGYSMLVFRIMVRPDYFHCLCIQTKALVTLLHVFAWTIYFSVFSIYSLIRGKKQLILADGTHVFSWFCSSLLLSLCLVWYLL